MAAAATSPNASNANVCIAFQINNELDRNLFTDICNGLLISDESDGSAIPTNVVAAVLASLVKGLASPRAYSSSITSQNALHAGGLRSLALNFLRFQSQFGPIRSAAGVPVTLVQVAQHCSQLVKKLDENKESSILVRICHYFLKYLSIIIGEDDTKPAATRSLASDDVKSFVELLSHALDNICFHTHQCLETWVDFDYLWAATVNDPGTDTPLYGPDGAPRNRHEGLPQPEQKQTSCENNPYKCPRCQKEFKFKSPKTAAASFSRHITACDGVLKDKKMKRKSSFLSLERDVDTPPLTAEYIRQVAKELAWMFQTTYSPYANTENALYNPQNQKQAFDRGNRIINAAACIDLIVAAMAAPSLSAPLEKRRRFEGRSINPRLSVEDESAAALSTVHHGTIELDLREKLKESLLEATAELLNTLAIETSPVEHKHIVERAQKVASSVLPLITDSAVSFSKKSSPASNLLSCISSHQMRKRNLLILKECYHSTMSDKVQVTTSNTPLGISRVQKALKIGWCICKLQRNFFVDSVNEFCQLSLSEQKILASFESEPPSSAQKAASTDGIEQNQFRVRAIKQQKVRPTRNAIQISRVKNPPTSEAEVKDLNEWVTAISCIVSTASSIKPSAWIIDHLESDGNGEQNQGWKSTIFPVLEYFLTIVAEYCLIDPRSCVISDNAEYKVQQDEITPGTVLQLYYYGLESITRSSTNTALIQNERFHSSLFSLCYFCLCKAKSPEGRCFLIEDIGEGPMVFYMLVESFIQALKPGSEAVTMNRALALPLYVVRILRLLQEMLLGVIWMTSCNSEASTEPTFADIVNKARETPAKWRRICPVVPGDKISTQEDDREQMLVNFMLCNLLYTIKQRVLTLCQSLLVISTSAIANMTMDVFTTMLYHRTDIFFDRHPDQLMLCSLYAAVCLTPKLLAKVSFQNIADAYMDADIFGSEISYAILHRIKNCSDHDDQFGDIISLFNEIFVPSVKPFWQSFKEKQGKALSESPECPTSPDNVVRPPLTQEDQQQTEDERDADTEIIQNGENKADSRMDIDDGVGINERSLEKAMSDESIEDHGTADMQTDDCKAPINSSGIGATASHLQEQKDGTANEASMGRPDERNEFPVLTGKKGSSGGE